MIYTWGLVWSSVPNDVPSIEPRSEWYCSPWLVKNHVLCNSYIKCATKLVKSEINTQCLFLYSIGLGKYIIKMLRTEKPLLMTACSPGYHEAVYCTAKNKIR